MTLLLRRGAEPITYMAEVWDKRYETPNPMCMEREVQELVWALVRALKPMMIVETGSYHGSTSEVIGNALESNGCGRLVSIESDEQWVEAARSRCAHLSRVLIVHADSITWGRVWRDRKIDLLIVDGSDLRDDEFLAFKPHLAPNALVLRHDALEGTPVRVGEFDGLDTVILNTPRGISLSQWPVDRPRPVEDESCES